MIYYKSHDLVGLDFLNFGAWKYMTQYLTGFCDPE